MAGPPVILASGSAARQRLLTEAGLEFQCHPARVDEAGMTEALKADGAEAEHAAEALAMMKAQQVSRKYPGALIIGADQMLDCDGTWLSKAKDETQARAQIWSLRGKTHRLWSSAAVFRDGERLWTKTEKADLTMRLFSETFLDWYLTEAGEALTQSVGGYHIEGLGAQLFTEVKGDYFVVQGLPLLALLGFLRPHGVLIP